MDKKNKIAESIPLINAFIHETSFWLKKKKKKIEKYSIENFRITECMLTVY